jgi:hypothetical protein
MDPERDIELEAGELRRRHEEEFRRERERRASDAAPEAPEHTTEVRWRPPAEMAAGKPKRALPRVFAFLVIIGGVYFALRFVTEVLFAPKLIALSPALPAETVTPGVPVTVGLYAKNERPRDGAAYAVLVFADGTEVEGPVVVVPGRDSVLVPVQATFTPGDHVTSLVLYDAWRENVEVGAVHGVLVQAGAPRVEVTSASLQPVARAADPIVVELQLSNLAEWSAAVTPLVVFTPGSGTGQAVEIELPRVDLTAGQTLPVRQTIAAGSVPPGRYLVSVVVVSASGERIGTGVHGLPFELGPADR